MFPSYRSQRCSISRNLAVARQIREKYLLAVCMNFWPVFLLNSFVASDLQDTCVVLALKSVPRCVKQWAENDKRARPSP